MAHLGIKWINTLPCVAGHYYIVSRSAETPLEMNVPGHKVMNDFQINTLVIKGDLC